MMIFVAMLLLFIAPLHITFSQHAPYPQSEMIKSFQWDTSTIMQHGQGSDQWPMTWAKDRHVYAAWGDGWG